MPEFNLSWPEWLRMPEFKLPEVSLPSFSFELPKFSWPAWLKFPEFSFSWPEISLPSISLPTFSFALPSFSMPSFDISFITDFFSEKFEATRIFFSDLIDKIIEIVMNFVNEVQVIWSENLNTVVNEKVSPATPEIVEEVVKVITEAPSVVESATEFVPEIPVEIH
jgi:hypothetical protein